MAKKQVKKKKSQKKTRPWVRVLASVCFLAVSVFLLYTVINEVMTTVKLHQQLAEVQAKLQEVEDENTYLTQQKEKLQDPDYVESYARGNYQLSKEGEQIFYLPENSNK